MKWYNLGPNGARSQETASLRNLDGKCWNCTFSSSSSLLNKLFWFLDECSEFVWPNKEAAVLWSFNSRLAFACWQTVIGTSNFTMLLNCNLFKKLSQDIIFKRYILINVESCSWLRTNCNRWRLEISSDLPSFWQRQVFSFSNSRPFSKCGKWNHGKWKETQHVVSSSRCSATKLSSFHRVNSQLSSCSQYTES